MQLCALECSFPSHAAGDDLVREVEAALPGLDAKAQGLWREVRAGR